MAQAQSPPSGVKRGPGRPSRAAQAPFKKVKASETPAQSSPSVQSSAAQSPAPSNATTKLPTRLSEYRPLPTLSSPQSLSLPTSTHQSLADSGVLQASLDRSRLRWVHDGMFDRYWTKPESGKYAKPPPPGNPEAKWMKHRGPCRIRVEPHIFECEVYVEEKPRPPVQKVPPQTQYGHGAYGAYGGQYRPGQQGLMYGQQRPLPPVHQQTPVRQSPAPMQPQRSQTPQQSTDKKPGPDPVISMLANRASSDPELKALMKEVATGTATAEQLKVFQSHIDDLTKIINERKRKEEEETAAAEAKKAQEQQQESIQYDGAPDQRPYQPPQPYQQPQPWQPPPPPAQQAVQTQTPSPPNRPPVILQFTTPGATEDRFLFPPNSILESLSPQHLLVSTLVIRKGKDSASPASLNPETEYFQPLTFLLEVAYGRESLLDLVKKSVNPADDVRAHMKGVMERCTRAPRDWLALRLPVKGAEVAEAEEDRLKEEEAGRKRVGVGLVVGQGQGVKVARKPGPQKGSGGRPVGVKNGEGGGKKNSVGPGGAGADGKEGSVAAASASVPAATTAGEQGTSEGSGQAAGDAASAKQADSGASEEKRKDGAISGPGMETIAEPQAEAGAASPESTGRPKRTVRKSVRISEG